MISHSAPSPRGPRSSAPIRCFYVAAFGALGVYVPIMPRWLETRGVVGIELGVIAASMPLMGLIAPIFFGALADTYRWRGWLLRIASVGSLAMMLLLGVLVRGDGPPYLALAACFYLFALFRSPMVLIADLVALEKGSDGYGRLRLFGSLGFMIAALAAGNFIDPHDGATMPFAMAACLFAALVAAYFVPGHAESHVGNTVATRGAWARDMRALVTRPGNRLFFAAAFAWALGHSSYDLCYVLHVRDVVPGDTAGGSLWALGVCIEIALLANSDRLFTLASPARLLVVALFASSLRWVAIAEADSLFTLAFAQPLHALSFGLGWLAFQRIVKDESPPELLGSFQGAFFASCALGGVLGALAWSHVYRSVGGVTMFRSAAVVSLFGTVLAAIYARPREPLHREPLHLHTRGQGGRRR
ncbi:MAG: hypothetical protein EXR75_04120 [Myxococcales bacterium]|nr:hypothetical protein [Myxococcales bacterium]